MSRQEIDVTYCKGCWYFDGKDCICYGENCHFDEVGDRKELACEVCLNSYFEGDKLRCDLEVCKPDYGGDWNDF